MAFSLPHTLTLKNQLREVTRVGKFLNQLCQNQGFSPQILFHLDLVLDELITNIISYGYPSDEQHEITLNFEQLDPTHLQIELIDSGEAFNPLEKKKPLISSAVEDRPIGGLGIYFARQFTEKMSYERKEGKNRLTIIIDLSKKIVKS